MILFFLFAFNSMSVDLSIESVYKFPAENFESDTAIGEWVTLAVTEKKQVVQVSKVKSQGINKLALKDKVRKLQVFSTMIAGEVDSREAGLLVVTNQREFFCAYKSTTQMTSIRDSLSTKYEDRYSEQLKSNVPVLISVEVEAESIVCELGGHKFKAILRSKEEITDMCLFTVGDTVASFLTL